LPSENGEEHEVDGMRFRNQVLPYWLDYVRNTGGAGSPVIVVQNQCDTAEDESLRPPAEDAQLDFPFVRAIHYSAKEDRGRAVLDDSLREAVKSLRNREGIAMIGKGRMKVRRKLLAWLDEDAKREPEERLHRILTQEEFRQLCEDAGDVSSPEALLEYLHHAGLVFYRKGLFHDRIVLDQSWALDAIYSVFHRQRCYQQLIAVGGRFTRPMLETLVWGERGHSEAEQELFLSMMTSCGMIFPHRRGDRGTGTEAEYIAPDLLPDRDGVAAQLAGRWEETGETKGLTWRYDFLHPGMSRSLISQIGGRAGQTAVYWRYGVWIF
jgi:internalin A